MYEMNGQTAIVDDIKKLTTPFIERGFSFEYLYEKGGDSSCVYICRFRKGRDFFDWREVSGGNEINIVAYVGGEYRFPSLKTTYKKEYRAFAIKHFFKKATMAEKRVFVAKILKQKLLSDSDNFFGIKI